MSTNVLVKSLAVLGVAILCSPAAHAATFVDLHPILNDSVSFPSTKTPGLGQAFDDFFEFTLPTAEYITASMSLSGPMQDQIPLDLDLRRRLARHPRRERDRASHRLGPVLGRRDGGRRLGHSVR